MLTARIILEFKGVLKKRHINIKELKSTLWTLQLYMMKLEKVKDRR